jgi:hypothetical protein
MIANATDIKKVICFGGVFGRGPCAGPRHSGAPGSVGRFGSLKPRVKWVASIVRLGRDGRPDWPIFDELSGERTRQPRNHELQGSLGSPFPIQKHNLFGLQQPLMAIKDVYFRLLVQRLKVDRHTGAIEYQN